MDPVIAVEELTFAYPNSARPALEQVGFQVRPGEFVGITGPAGAGKSTLVLCLNGIIPHFQGGAFQGKVAIQGTDTFTTSCGVISRVVGSVFQDPEAQLVGPTVEDEIAFGLENFGYPAPEIEERIADALRLVGISQLRERSVVELSGGQKQRVAIAAAVALRPQILVLDEPTSELDPIGTLEVFQVLQYLNREHHLTIVVVEQKLNVLLEYIDRLLILDHGKLLADRTPREVVAEPSFLQTIGLAIPPVSELAYRLRQNGYYHHPDLPLTVDEAYQGLQKTLGGHR